MKFNIHFQLDEEHVGKFLRVMHEVEHDGMSIEGIVERAKKQAPKKPKRASPTRSLAAIKHKRGELAIAVQRLVKQKGTAPLADIIDFATRRGYARTSIYGVLGRLLRDNVLSRPRAGSYMLGPQGEASSEAKVSA